MDSKKPLYKSIPFWGMVFILLYSALGFFAVPHYIKSQSKQLVSLQLNSMLAIEDVSFNPFTFSSSLSGVKLTDKDSTLWFSANEIEININFLNSVFNNLSIQELSIHSPYYKIVTQNKNNEISVKYPTISISEKDKAVEQEILLDINKISITKGAIEYNDKSSKKHFNLNLKELNFTHKLFTTKDSDSQFNLTFKTGNNDKTILSGLFNFAQLKLNVKWKLENWETTTLFTFISDENKHLYGFKNQSGLINASGTILYQAIKDEQSKINIEQLNLTNFNNTHDGNSFDIEKVSLRATVIDLIEQSISIEEVTTNGALAELTFDKDNNIVWSNFKPQNIAESSETKKPWSFIIQQVNNSNSSVKVNKLFKDSSQQNIIELKTTSIKNISSDSSQTIELNADIVLDETGEINLQSQIIAEPFKVNSTINAKNIDLSKFSAWTPSTVKLSINKGLLSLQQQLNFSNQLELKGQVQINDLELFDKNKLPFLLVNQLNVEQLSLSSASKTIKLNKIELNQAQGALTLSADKQLNLLELVESSDEDKKDNDKTNDWIIEINQIKLIDAKTSFIDKSIKPQYQTELAKINGDIKGLSNSNRAKADVNLSGVLDSYGKIAIKGKINPLSDKAYTDLTIDISNVDLQSFSSYSSKYLGFPINRGKANFNLKYKLTQNVLKGINDLTFKQLKFGTKTASKDAVDLPLKLAVSLLTDGKGAMKINMPVSGNIGDPEFSYGGLVFKAFFKLVTGIVASPFKLLGKLIPGGADLDLSSIHFQAGSIQLQTGEEEKLKAMQQILSKKPKLLLELTGIIHTENDSKALRIQQLLQKIQLEAVPDFTDKSQFNLIKKFFISQNSKENWQKLLDESSNGDTVKNTVVLEKAWNQLLTQQSIDDELSQLAKQRALFTQSQLIEKYSITQDRIFMKSGEKSQELPPQVKFGIAQ